MKVTLGTMKVTHKSWAAWNLSRSWPGSNSFWVFEDGTMNHNVDHKVNAALIALRAAEPHGNMSPFEDVGKYTGKQQFQHMETLCQETNDDSRLL